MPSGNSLRVVRSIDFCNDGCISPSVRFLSKVSRSTPSMRSSGSRMLPLLFDIFCPSLSRIEGVDVDVAERHVAHELQSHHHHARDPEEDDVEARDEHAGGIEGRELRRLVRPAERRERPERRGEPGVEHVLVLREG